HGRENVLKKVQECYASLFTDRATYYRIKQNFPQEKVALSAAIQMMAFSKAAGVMFTVNVATGDDTKVMIEASWGLGEYVVSGTVTHDNYVDDKNTMNIVHKMVTKMPIELITVTLVGTIEQMVAPDEVDDPALPDAQIIELAGYAKEIE